MILCNLFLKNTLLSVRYLEKSARETQRAKGLSIYVYVKLDNMARPVYEFSVVLGGATDNFTGFL